MGNVPRSPDYPYRDWQPGVRPVSPLSATSALILLGLLDWLTTVLILREPGGYERGWVAAWGMKHLGATPFFVLKTLVMGLLGWFSPWGWLGAGLVAFYTAILINNLLVLRSFHK